MFRQKQFSVGLLRHQLRLPKLVGLRFIDCLDSETRMAAMADGHARSGWPDGPLVAGFCQKTAA